MKPAIIAAAALIVAGCATTYTPPEQSAVVGFRAATTASIPNLVISAKRALAMSGHQVTADDAAGVVMAAPKVSRVTPAQADCGKTMGLDYLLDNRTTTRVSYAVMVSPGWLEIRATIEGEYKPGSVVQDMALTCISHGTLERQLAQQILSTL